MSSLACAPNALADQCEKKERFVSKICSLKSELLQETYNQVPQGEKLLPLNTYRALKNGHQDKSQRKR